MIYSKERKEIFLGKYDYAYSFEFLLSKLNSLEQTDYTDTIVAEFPLGLIVNGKYENTFLCSPFNLKELVLGYLSSRDFINCYEDVLDLSIDEEKKIAYVKTNPINPKDNNITLYLNEFDYLNTKRVSNDEFKINVSSIYKNMRNNLNLSDVFKKTAGVHCISLYDKYDNLVVSCEDVARHNALDKVIGHCILNNIQLDDKIIYVSGRFSFEMVKKAAKFNVPIIVSKSAITSLVIETAKNLNITLVGFVRGDSMNIYTNPHRINLE